MNRVAGGSFIAAGVALTRASSQAHDAVFRPSPHSAKRIQTSRPEANPPRQSGALF